MPNILREKLFKKIALSNQTIISLLLPCYANACRHLLARTVCSPFRREAATSRPDEKLKGFEAGFFQ